VKNNQKIKVIRIEGILCKTSLFISSYFEHAKISACYESCLNYDAKKSFLVLSGWNSLVFVNNFRLCKPLAFKEKMFGIFCERPAFTC
jgi:hypothetical protein